MEEKILIVDDELLFVQALVSFLGKNNLNYKIVTARHGLEALQILERDRIDLAILDINMPVLDGIELLLELHNRNIWLPTLILTSQPLSMSRFEGDAFEKYGIVGFMDKPVNFDDLYKRIEHILKRYKRYTSSINILGILQVIKMERRTGVLTLRLEGRDGRIFFKDGDVMDVEVNNLKGEDALRECIRISDEGRPLQLEYLHHERSRRMGSPMPGFMET